MSSTLFDKLKQKPVPQVKESITVNIPTRKTVEIKDKRGDKLVNREELLRKMREPRERKRQEPVAPVVAPVIAPVDVPVAPVDVPVAPVDVPVDEPVAPVDEPVAPVDVPVVAPVDKPKKPKATKKGKKLRIVGISKGTISTAPVPAPRKTRAPDLTVVMEARPTEAVVGETIKADILPREKAKVIVRASDYYLNNRQIFVSFINKLFQQYRDDVLKEREEAATAEGEDIIEAKCNKPKTQAFVEFELLTHQKVVRDYLNLYTPYRGLLLYHGLGSGKTCSSIAIAEGMKSSKQI